MKTAAMKTVRMAVKALLLSFTAVIPAMWSCTGTGTEPTGYDRDELIVQANLYAERPVDDIRVVHLTKNMQDTMVRFEKWNQITAEYDTIDTILSLVKDSIVDDALVTISSNGTSYVLSHRDSGWYQETSGNLKVIGGHTYRIDVTADGRHAWAEATVPLSIEGLSVSIDTLYMPGSEDPLDTIPSDIPWFLTVKWNNPEGIDFYYKFIFDSDTPEYGLSDGTYTDKDSLAVRIGYGTTKLMYSGGEFYYITKPARYKFLLYSTTPEYRAMLAELIDSTTHQDKWIESPSNIIGGLGFFAAFNIDSVYFNIAQWDGGS